jgi:hypothetical protein
MKRLFLLVAVLIISAIFTMAVPVVASDENAASKPFQVTTSPRYDRNPSFFKSDDGTYWLFFARGRNPEGIRGINGYDPDTDSYDIYYKTARSIPSLRNTKEQLVPGSDLVDFNTQRDITALQASDGTIWVFTSSGYATSSDPRVFYYRYKHHSWSGPTPIPNTSYAGHINSLEHKGQIWVFFDAWAYSLKVIHGNESGWSVPVPIRDNTSIAKAIVYRGKFYIVWSYVENNVSYGPYIGLSTSKDGTTWTNHGAIASWPGATNWDPVLIRDKKAFRLFWAPDAGVEGQFIATSMASDPTDLASWSAPVKLTIAKYGINSWWDFWPQPYYDGLTYLAYTSERNAAGTNMGDGNIWMMHLTVPLPR